MSKQPVFIQDGDAPTFNKPNPLKKLDRLPPEHELGGGDICSLEHEASTDDDAPLD